MKILLTVNRMGSLVGASLYTYELARELSKKHCITILSNWEITGRDGEKYHEGLNKIKKISCMQGNYDVVIASEFCPNIKCPKINIVHSEYDCETPLPNCNAYVTIRPSIKKHIIDEHNISPKKIHIIYNGVDRKRFKSIKKPIHNYKLTVVPCTRDFLREKFLNL
ncbi:MAG: hypothetical protein L3J54_06735 [Draconibacterium sp.]|nr:hypothetical protein [Draconibacterium sp.]